MFILTVHIPIQIFRGKGLHPLFIYLLLEAKNRGLKRLYVEASLFAKPFVEHHGFSVVQKNSDQRHGVSLVNFTLEIYLGAGNLIRN